MIYTHPITDYGKRFFDVSTALIILIITLPFFPIIALAIRLESKGPIFFRQMRVGRIWDDRADLFLMIKFRTMIDNAEAKTGAILAVENDPRITRVGAFLRRTRMDELPQMFNLLRGDMALIGPRPERPNFYSKLEKDIPFFTERTYGVAPGITGFAQVNQGYDTGVESVRTKLSYDHAYALSLASPWTWFQMDTMIFFRTFWVMLARKGQ